METAIAAPAQEKFVFHPHAGCAECILESAKYKADWETMLSLVCPHKKRPRRTSIHTLAIMCGRKDPLAMAKEMKASGKVEIYVCPDVKTPITYLKTMMKHPGMITGDRPETWDQLEAFFEKNPYPAVKGFKRFAENTWTGGAYGKGQMIPANSAMNVPYEKEDFDLARLIIKTLKDAGFTPGIEDPANIPSDEVLATTLK
jgi:hypothetical protein